MRNDKSNGSNNNSNNSNRHDDDDEDTLPSTFNVLFFTLFLPLVIVAFYGKKWTPQPELAAPSNTSFQTDSRSSAGGTQNQYQHKYSSYPSTVPSPSYNTDSRMHKNNDDMAINDNDQKRGKNDDPPPQKVAEKSTKKNTGVSSGVKDDSSSSESLNGIVGKRSVGKEPLSDKRPQSKHTRTHDPARVAVDNKIAMLRGRVDQNPNDVQSLTELANNLRNRDLHFAGAGVDNDEIFWCYEKAIIALNRFMGMVDASGREELSLFLCALTVYYGVSFQSSDMYDDAVNMYSQALNGKCPRDELLRIHKRRGDSYLILGKFEESGRDFRAIYDIDQDHFFNEAMGSINRLLNGSPNAFPGGWDSLLSIVYQHLPSEKLKFENASEIEERKVRAKHLQKMHYALFIYHDTITFDVDKAWNHLEQSQEYKAVYTKTAWEHEFGHLIESKTIFNRNFLDKMQGSGIDTRAPIFLIGFPRSGTTLLERVLDAHPNIAGLGETSALATVLPSLRAELGRVTEWGALHNTINTNAEYILQEMKLRWQRIFQGKQERGEDIDKRKEHPLRIVDKLNTNHRVIGFMHLLFPRALIIHCARNPMDTIFSSYKHDFNVEVPTETGELQNYDNFSTFKSVSKMYESFREMISLYESVLPTGRIMNVRYEELVDDLEGVARNVIAAAGLEWHDSVLDFHKKKQTVNTFSSTQVRSKINRKGIDSWKKYASKLRPLIELVGKYNEYDMTTSTFEESYYFNV